MDTPSVTLQSTKLYTLIQENIKTGRRAIIYGHATHNVMDLYWRAYADENHRVIIQEYVPR